MTADPEEHEGCVIPVRFVAEEAEVPFFIKVPRRTAQILFGSENEDVSQYFCWKFVDTLERESNQCLALSTTW
jgi:hypothetical protein